MSERTGKMAAPRPLGGSRYHGGPSALPSLCLSSYLRLLLLREKEVVAKLQGHSHRELRTCCAFLEPLTFG